MLRKRKMTTKKKSSRKVVKFVNGRIIAISDKKNESVIQKPDLSKYYFSNRKSIERFIEIEVEPRPEKYYEFDRNRLLLWFLGKYFK